MVTQLHHSFHAHYFDTMQRIFPASSCLHMLFLFVLPSETLGHVTFLRSLRP